MKHFFFFIAVVAATLPASAQELTFESTTLTANDIPESGIHYFDFHFKNTGNAPLIITECKKTCGCTTPEWPKEPIAPGESGTIQVGFNTDGRPGAFSKPVTVISNAVQNGSGQVIYFKGNVVPKG